MNPTRLSSFPLFCLPSPHPSLGWLGSPVLPWQRGPVRHGEEWWRDRGKEERGGRVHLQSPASGRDPEGTSAKRQEFIPNFPYRACVFVLQRARAASSPRLPLSYLHPLLIRLITTTLSLCFLLRCHLSSSGLSLSFYFPSLLIFCLSPQLSLPPLLLHPLA